MTLYNNNNEKEADENLLVITWNTTRKRSVYNPKELQNLRTSSGTGDDGFKYFNNFTNAYERPRSLVVIPKSKLSALAPETRSASSSTSSKNNNNNNNRRVPAHLRLHRILNGGPGFSLIAQQYLERWRRRANNKNRI